jgi:hypothetical protein
MRPRGSQTTARDWLLCVVGSAADTVGRSEAPTNGMTSHCGLIRWHATRWPGSTSPNCGGFLWQQACASAHRS